jgi:hypothetical protein
VQEPTAPWAKSARRVPKRDQFSIFELELLPFLAVQFGGEIQSAPVPPDPTSGGGPKGFSTNDGFGLLQTRGTTVWSHT